MPDKLQNIFNIEVLVCIITYQYRSGGMRGPEKGLIGGRAWAFFCRASSFNKSIRGGARPVRSPRLVTASFTSSTSIV